MNADTLRSLVREGARESSTLEFKRDLYGTSETEKREFLKDVSALANTLGGFLLIGVDEDRGAASGFGNHRFLDFDAIRERLLNWVNQLLDPPISGLRIDLVGLEENVDVIVIQIPASLTKPHRIKQGESKFWRRTDHGNQPLDTYEIRNQMQKANLVEADIVDAESRFFDLVLADGLPVRVASPVKLAVRITPIGTLLDQALIDLVEYKVELEEGRHRAQVTPVPGYMQKIVMGNQGLSWSSMNHSFNFEGIFGTDYDDKSCAQLSRHGHFEYMFGLPDYTSPRKTAISIEVHAVYACMMVAPVIRRLPLSGPFRIAISLLFPGAKEFTRDNNERLVMPAGRYDLPHFLLAEIPNSALDVKLAAAPVFDVIWQTFGLPKSEYAASAENWPEQLPPGHGFYERI